jgi:cell division protein FtsN
VAPLTKAEKKRLDQTPAAAAPEKVAEKKANNSSAKTTKKIADKASAKLRKKSATAAPAPVAKAPPAAVSAPADSASASTDEALPMVGTAAGHYLTVGTFAEVGNARRAQAKLLNAGLPAFRQTVTSPKGELIRVRVGPYNSAAEAQKASQQIRRMGLEAVALRQRGK